MGSTRVRSAVQLRQLTERRLEDLDGSRALVKAASLGDQTLIQRCRIHKKRDILKYLRKSEHRLFGLKWSGVWKASQYIDGQAMVSGGDASSRERLQTTAGVLTDAGVDVGVRSFG